MRKVGPSGSLLANAALLPFRRSLGPLSEQGGVGGSHGNSVGTVVCGDRAGRKGGRAQRGKCALEQSQAEAFCRLGPTAIARRLDWSSRNAHESEFTRTFKQWGGVGWGG